MGDMSEELYQISLNETNNRYINDSIFRDSFNKAKDRTPKQYWLDNCGDGYVEYCMRCCQPDCMKREKYRIQWEELNKSK